MGEGGGQSDGARGLKTKRNKRFHGYKAGQPAGAGGLETRRDVRVRGYEGVLQESHFTKTEPRSWKVNEAVQRKVA